MLCPYNYLIDPTVRAAMGLDAPLKGAVVVIDEAHNVADVAADAASTSVGLEELRRAAGQLADLEAAGAAPLGPCAGLRQVLEGLAAWLESAAAELTAVGFEVVGWRQRNHGVGASLRLRATAAASRWRRRCGRARRRRRCCTAARTSRTRRCRR